MTDFTAMYAQAKLNEMLLRGAIESTMGNKCPLDVLQAYTGAVELCLALRFYLEEHSEDEDDTGSSSPTSSLRDTLDGEGTEKNWERFKDAHPEIGNEIDPPDGVV